MLNSTRQATAVAHPNIALAKYWGKRDSGQNEPAVPSLSVTLEGMSTTTVVCFDDSLVSDVVLLNGKQADSRTTTRVTGLLDRIRFAASLTSKARVTSTNDFPTASGLASSASGFAALALAATAAAGLERPRAWVSDLARRTSASSARSVFGGFVELLAGSGADLLSASVVVEASHLPLRMLIAVTTEDAKDTLSSDGMQHTAATSPFYRSWIETAPQVFSQVKNALLNRDLEALGHAAEHSALMMHASAIAAEPGLVYWRGATVDALREVRSLRKSGVGVWGTMDAGPHLKAICAPADVDRVREHLLSVPGVLRVIVGSPGGVPRVTTP